MFKNNPNDKKDPPAAYNQQAIPPAYVSAPSERVVAAPYVATSSPARGLTPISLPGSRSIPHQTSSTASTPVVMEPTEMESKETEKKSKKEKKAKKVKKEKRMKKEKVEREESIEAVLVSPSSTTDKTGEKKKKKKKPVVIVSETPTMKSPPPFVFPTGTMNLSEIFIPGDSKSWKLSNKLLKGCDVVDLHAGREICRHRELHIPVESSENIIYVSTKKDDQGDVLAMYVEQNSLMEMSFTRNHRTAILTRGSLQFKKPSFSVTQCFVYFKEKDSPNINISLFDLRGIHVGDSSSNAVIVAYQKEREHDDTIRYAIYQTPDTSRFLLPLAKAVLAAYTSVPQWAIPISWSGDLPPLPAISQHEYNAWMGKDGGFSSLVYAACLAHHVKNKIDFASFQQLGSGTIASEIMKQQEKRRHSFPAASFGPQSIDLISLATALGNGNTGVVSEIVYAGLNALSFNLVFRKLKLAGARFDRKDKKRLHKYRNALGRLLLYNVTLREVDFEMTNLCEFGETIGNAWAMNVQPLISRVNFSGCQLTGDDLYGLLRGFSRIWCSGTALAEVIQMARNPDIPSKAWDSFFRAFVDPSMISSWSRSPPSPPTLSFLQELDVRGTKAMGPGLVEIASKLTGLRTLKLSSNGENFLASDILGALKMTNAPLEIFEFEGEDPRVIQALFQHKTLKEITFIGFCGDGRPLLCDWPQPMPKLSLSIGKNYIPKTHPSSKPSLSGYSPATIFLSNSNNFCIGAMETLANRANGLKKLVVNDTYYWQLTGAAYGLANCGLEIFHVYPPKIHGENSATYREIQNQTKSLVSKINTVGLAKVEGFWETLASSKTLRDIQCPDQLMGGEYSYEVGMIGRFLKRNRSVQKIGFDHHLLILTVENVKELRSAFYGNKKVIEMEYLSMAKERTLRDYRRKTDDLLSKIAEYKREIKMLFKRAYSKYNRRWRDGPNRDKLPWIEKIRVAKREIGKLNRDQAKIATLLEEIMNCIQKNKHLHTAMEEQKAGERLTRRSGQLNQLAEKKKKFVTDLVTKLRKAKIRGRKQKPAKAQVPRSTYYKSSHMWPSHKRKSKHRRRRRRYDDTMDWDSSYSSVSNDSEGNCEWLESCVEDVVCESEDPWTHIDSLVKELDANYNSAIDPEYLADIHQECSDLGVDVLDDVSHILDVGASVADKLNEIEVSTNASNEMLTAFVDSNLDRPFDLASVERDLPDVADYDMGDVVDDVMDADDAVRMYAGAGPRDLDDGGPSFGNSRNAARSGARRSARNKKRYMDRIREKANRRLQVGYRNLSIVRTTSVFEARTRERDWPLDIASRWVEEARMEQIKAMANSDLFELPEVSGKPHSLQSEWSFQSNDRQQRRANIEVVLVTQCSIDRLPNLQAQLESWTGKASVAIYLKPATNESSAIDDIVSVIKQAKAASESMNFDIAVTIVEGCSEDEPYPINYLRNVALLEAKRQYLRFNKTLDQLATFLVDVDFRPSSDLHKILHSKHAANLIVNEGKVVVCPAFETISSSCPSTVSALRQQVDKNQAEGFHQSHFPQGHGPTQFERFWKKSLYIPDSFVENPEDYFWNESYGVSYENMFEPYIVVSSRNVPLYDERFQGYGLNKVSHLASVSKETEEFLVLPGVFVVAPAHERSEAWGKIYGGSQSEDKKFNQLALKGLFYNFKKNLEDGKKPVVSDTTRLKQEFLVQKDRESRQKLDTLNESFPNNQLASEFILCY